MTGSVSYTHLLLPGGQRNGDIRPAHDGQRLPGRVLQNGEQAVVPRPQDPVQRAGHVLSLIHIYRRLYGFALRSSRIERILEIR